MKIQSHLRFKQLQLCFINIAWILLITNSASYSQQVLNWTGFVDLNKNGFLYTKSIDGHPIILKQGKPEYAEIYEDQTASQIKNNKNVVVYYKSNGKMILLWGDTRNRVSPYEYDEILQIGVNTFKVKIKEKWGVIDSLGKIIIPIKYSAIEPLDPGLSYNTSSQIYNSEHNLEIQLFYCDDFDWDNREVFLINRKGDTLLNNSNKNFVEPDKIVNYFIHDKKIYAVYSKKDKFLIGLFGKSPTLEFDGEILSDEDNRNINFSTWAINKLIKPIKKDREIIFFDFGKQKFIDSIPSFNKFGYRIGAKYIQTISYNDPSERTYTLNILSNELEVIAEDLDYLEIDNFQCVDCYEQINNDYYNQHQIDKDSLLLFKKNNSPNNWTYAPNLYGIYKIGVGEFVDAKYEQIIRVNKNICQITEPGEVSQNFLDLRTLKKIFPKNFESISEINSGGNNNLRVYECVFEGKITKVSYPIR